MIDTHCHIIPDVDDGSESMSMSMMMAAMAVDDGVEEILATPHVLWDNRYTEQRLRRIKRHAEDFKQEIVNARMPLTLHVGAEVLCAVPARNLLEQGLFPRLASTDYALIEFYFDEPFDYMTECLEAVANVGICPIIAHPERYGCIQKRKENAIEWIERGYFLQVNKGSINGDFGHKVKKTVDWILKNKLAHLMATDAHDISHRTTRLSSGAYECEKKHGYDYAVLLTEVNPKRLLANERLIQF
ncbi:Manganese-dependent protein-tyrosine phosphatase [Lachnospiraceae bacterium TWA4]|nr:Manganese-dependent protein-tyrosine phosphatase [Lachnospiraceae bacterium TWA4]